MNSLFIGLGGAGTYAVAELQKKFNEYDRTVENPSSNKFAYIDTDLAVKTAYPFVDAHGDFFPLSGNNTPASIIKTQFNKANDRVANSLHFREWVDRYNPDVASTESLYNGAAGVRMLSRIALFQKHNNLSDFLKDKMSINGKPVTRIYVISGTCGGTGCGTVLDILYMIQDIKTNNPKTKYPEVQLMMVLPQGYVSGLKENDLRHRNYTLNAYGLFTEMNAVLKDMYSSTIPKRDENGRLLGHDSNGNEKVVDSEDKADKIPASDAGLQFTKFSAVPVSAIYQNTMQFNPFFIAYLFDSYNPNTMKAYTYKQVSDFVSNFIFNLEVGQSIIGSFDSTYSNVIKGARINSASDDFIDAFSATGSFTVQTQEELLKSYVQDKFIYQMMTYGFVGVQDESKVSLTPITRKGGIQATIDTKITAFVDDLWNKLSTLFPEPSKDNLKSVLKKYFEQANESRPKYDVIFADWNVGNNPNRVFNDMCSELADEVNKACKVWIVEYNLRYARKLITELDLMQTRKHNELAKIIEQKSKEKYFKQSSAEKDVKATLKTYTELLVCKYLALDGVLDRSATEIEKCIDNLNFNSYVIRDKVPLVNWYGAYIKRLMELNTDKSRMFLPAISTILNGSKLSDSSGFDAKYAELVRQDESMPDLTPYAGDDDRNGDLLYTFKHKIMQDIYTRDHNFENLFRPDSLNQNDNWKTILETFRKETDKAAYYLVKDAPTLKIDIASQMSSETTKNEVAQALCNYDNLVFSDAVVDQSTNKPVTILYVGDFSVNSTIENKIIELSSNSQMEYKFSSDQNLYWHDRIVKIIVKMNYSIDEYSYFNKYKEFFARYYQENRSEVSYHQPFLSKKFWDCRNADVVQLFKDEALKTTSEIKAAEEKIKQQNAENERNIRRISLNWNSDNNQILAFCFTSLLLCEYFKKMKTLSNTKDFFKKFKAKKTAKTTTPPMGYDVAAKKMTLTKSDDYVMDPNASEFRISETWSKKLNTLNVLHILEEGKEYVAYWINIIKSQKDIAALQERAINEIYRVSYDNLQKLNGKKLSAEDISEFAKKYYNTLSSRKEAETDIFEDFMLWFN